MITLIGTPDPDDETFLFLVLSFYLDTPAQEVTYNG